jgi:single-strand DNA-binding protein
MAGVNKVILVGNLGKDPEAITFDNGVKKVSFSLATSESYKDKEGNRIDQTEWHNIVLWRGLADIAEKYLTKGSQVYIEGKIRTRSWDDKDGNKRYTTEINADNLIMLGGARREQNGTSNQISEPAVNNTPTPEDDLPF